jgi:hypothetical protein
MSIKIAVGGSMWGVGGRSVTRPDSEMNRRVGSVNPKLAKAGGLQSQGVKGEAVISYRNPLTTQDLKSSGFPAG